MTIWHTPPLTFDPCFQFSSSYLFSHWTFGLETTDSIVRLTQGRTAASGNMPPQLQVFFYLLEPQLQIQSLFNLGMNRRRFTIITAEASTDRPSNVKSKRKIVDGLDSLNHWNKIVRIVLLVIRLQMNIYLIIQVFDSK